MLSIWDAGPERVMLKSQIDNAGWERAMHKTQENVPPLKQSHMDCKNRLLNIFW